MSRLFLVGIALLAVVLVFGFERLASAGGGLENEPASFQASFKFGQDARSTAYRTDWYVQSAFTDSIQFHTVYLTIPTQIVTRTVGQSGYADYISTDLDYPRYPRGFQLISSGTGKRARWLLVSTQWYTDSLPGPEILVELHEFSPVPKALIVVRNTTLLGMNLYGTDGTKLCDAPILPGGWQMLTFRESGSVSLKVLDESVEKESATVSWTLPQPATGPTPTPTAQPITMAVSVGWELIAMPQTRRAYRVSDLAAEMIAQGITVTQIVRWRNGMWESHIPGFEFNNYQMEARRSYFLRIERSGVWRTEN